MNEVCVRLRSSSSLSRPKSEAKNFDRFEVQRLNIHRYKLLPLHTALLDMQKRDARSFTPFNQPRWAQGQCSAGRAVKTQTSNDHACR